MTNERKVRVVSSQVRVCLVSDPDTDKAAAAMTVRVGHLQDPWEIPGLAHFLEHMLFLGTLDYPVEGEYKRFLHEHAGSCNASTSMETTTFYFDVADEFLPSALHRFISFFICPLMNEESALREVHAVDAENEKNLLLDSRRHFQMWKALSSREHPFAKFGTGNIKTLFENPSKLNIDTRRALKEFHSRFYSARMMNLTVLGKRTV